MNDETDSFPLLEHCDAVPRDCLVDGWTTKTAVPSELTVEALRQWIEFSIKALKVAQEFAGRGGPMPRAAKKTAQLINGDTFRFLESLSEAGVITMPALSLSDPRDVDAVLAFLRELRTRCIKEHHGGDLEHAAARHSGRRSSYDDLYRLHDQLKRDNPTLTDVQIFAAYSRKFKASKSKVETWHEPPPRTLKNYRARKKKLPKQLGRATARGTR